MAEQFRVDLEELDVVVRQLRHLQRDMDDPHQTVKYGTAIPKSAFGGDFIEAGKLAGAHDGMQTYMADVLGALQDLIRTFGEKTEASRGAYEDQEHETRPPEHH
ncbi:MULTISPECIES: hypothetical protein [Streptomyces]|uniref:Uncharacterized protein n=2 Tax=Streptomyces TaxID=1883 RepID=A0A2N8PE65_STRNR|nr:MULTISPECIES: hypothetical protein [Streptomyces]PNE39302.1 hypothetical protein AOB60_36075 [Streptomyces noursei]SHM35996.1 hypothetical protein SAMN05216268_110176 [Streptomyces yunnanensis]